MRILLISILGLLTLASCTKQEPMEALIDRVFTVAEQQYTTMYNPQIEMFARFKMKSSFHKTKRII